MTGARSGTAESCRAAWHLLRRRFQSDDGQVLSAVMVIDRQFQTNARPAADLGGRECARRSDGPPRPRLEAWPAAGGGHAAVSFLWRPTGRSCMRPEAVIPVGIRRGVRHKRLFAKRHNDPAEAFILHRTDEPFDVTCSRVVPGKALCVLERHSCRPGSRKEYSRAFEDVTAINNSVPEETGRRALKGRAARLSYRLLN